MESELGLGWLRVSAKRLVYKGKRQSFMPLRLNTPPRAVGTPSAIAYGVGPMKGEGTPTVAPKERSGVGSGRASSEAMPAARGMNPLEERIPRPKR